MAAVVPVDLAEEFRRIVAGPLPAVKHFNFLADLYRPRRGRACRGGWSPLVRHSQSFPKDVGEVRDHIS